MVIFQYNLYIFGIHLGTVLYPKPCYNKPCYKEVEVYMKIIHCQGSLEVPRRSTANESHNICFHGEIRKISAFFGQKKALSGDMFNKKLECQCHHVTEIAFPVQTG